VVYWPPTGGLQPELLGAIGLLKLQAGPHCRLVLQPFDRLGAPERGQLPT